MDRKANIAESMGVGVGDDAPGLVSRPASGTPARWQGVNKSKNAIEVPVDRIQPDPDQPRTEFDPEALDRLARSLKERGQLQPIRVRWDESAGRYVVVVGERRWRAAQLAGLETLACVVVTGEPSPEDLLEDQLVENALREDLKPIEQARAYRCLMTSRGLTQAQLAERLQIRQGTVAKALALLALPEPIQASVDAGEIGTETAYELSKIDDRAQQVELARDVAAGRLNRDAVKEHTRASRKGRGVGKGAGKAKKITTRVFRTATGKATVELRKGSGNEAILEVAREVVRILEAELGEATQEAA
jgi:ParB family transcriptional regulator, chromosome partitioning protein